MATTPYINEQRAVPGLVSIPGEYVVRAIQIATTETVVISAWQRIEGCTSHSSITSDNGRWLGRVGTGPLPDSFKELANGTPERSAACKRFRHHEGQFALELIERVYPGILSCDTLSPRGGGDVQIDVIDFRALLRRESDALRGECEGTSAHPAGTCEACDAAFADLYANDESYWSGGEAAVS